MNKSYRLIWSAVTNSWVAVSEIARSHGKSSSLSRKSSRVLAALAMSLPFLSTVQAAQISLAPTWDPSVNNNKAGSYVVSGGASVDVVGPSAFTGSTDQGTAYLLPWDAIAQGYATGDDIKNLNYVDKGSKSKTVTIIDPDSHLAVTVNVYDSSRISQRGAGTLEAMTVLNPGIPYFYDTRLVTVDSTGGHANFDMGANRGALYFKNSSLAYADGTGSANSSITWSSTNIIGMSPAGVFQPANINTTKNIDSIAYNASFSDYLGNPKSVNSLAELQAYNNWLIAEMAAGNLRYSQYEAELAKATITTTHSYAVSADKNGTIDSSAYTKPIGINAVLHGKGAKAKVTLLNGATISGRGPNGGVIYVEQSATGINEGAIISYGVSARAVTGGQLINDGQIVVNLPMADGIGVYVSGTDTATGQNSQFTNNGVVDITPYIGANVAVSPATAMTLSSGGEGVNNGIINLTAGNSIKNDAESVTVGARVMSGGAFTNTATGTMTIGYNAGASVHGALETKAVNVEAGAGHVENAGLIKMSENTQGAYGLYVKGAGVVDVVNSGTIEINGADGASPAQNMAIYVDASSGVKNTGTINLNGINAAAMKIVKGGSASSSGVINVSSSDPSSTLRNYGAWVEGTGSHLDVTGAVNLSKDGSIGLHVRDGADIALSGDGVVNFVEGTNQIGFFVYGPNSVVTNTSTKPMDVSTEDSTLFRVASGAKFLGGSSAQVTASGKNSKAIVATGKTGADISTFDSGAMTIDLTGEGATGVLVEGGAKGNIDSSATIHLANASAIAGISDGQAHDINDVNQGNPDDTTLLTAGANLNSDQDRVTGYIARNKGTVNNSGNITFTGDDTVGILVEEGSKGINSGSISLNNGGIGLYAKDSGNQATTIDNTGTLTLNGGSNTNRTTGIYADGSAVAVNMTAGLIDMKGQGAIGVVAREGASVSLAGTAVPQFAAEATGVTDQIAFLIEGAGSSIITDVPAGTVLDASGKDSTLFRIAGGAEQSGVLQMKTSGNGATGIWATGDDTIVSTAAGSDFQVLGKDARALNVNGGAHATIGAGTTVNLVGDGAIVGMVDGNEYALDGVTVIRTDTDAKLTNDADLSSGLSEATGFITQNQGQLINNGKIDFSSGVKNIGIKVLNGQLENHADVTVNGVAVYVEGAHSKVDNVAGVIKATDGEAAIKLGSGASLDLGGSGVGKITAGGSAHGVLLDTGAVGLKVDGAYIDMASIGAGTGNGIENKAEISGIQLTNTTQIDVKDGKGVRTSASLADTNAGTINVMGSGVGLAFETASGGASTLNVDLSKSSDLNITVSAQDGTGIRAKTSGTVNTAANVNVTHAAGGSALELVGVKTATNAGKLISVSTTDATVALGSTNNFTNTLTGEISSADTAMSFDTQNSTLTNQGKIAGLIKMNEGNNTVTNSGTFSGNVTAGNGNNTVVLESGSSSQNITAGTGVNQFTVKGTATFLALDGGLGAGDDILNFDGATYLLNNTAAIQHFEKLNLINNSVFTTNVVLDMTNTAGGVGKVDIATGSEFAVKNVAAGNYAFNHALTGSGVISSVLNATTNSFDFGADVGSDFAGTAKLGTGTFALSGNNTTALTNASLQLDSGNATTVGAGNQAIGGLTFNGGKTIFDVEIPSDKEASGKITTSAAGTLDVSGTGTVQVNIPSSFVNDQPLVDTKRGLLEQDDATALVQLIDAQGTVVGTGGQLSLVDQNGVAISNAQNIDISQNSNKVAVGTYDYRANTGENNDGLYVSYGLKEVELLGTDVNALVLAPTDGATGLATDLSAKITGAGDLAIAAGEGKTVSLSNAGNTYTGETLAQSGTLKLADNNVLGKTANLAISSGATVDMNGKSQSVGQINTASGGKLDITTGSTLTIDDTQRTGGSSGGSLEANTLFGGGDFIIDPSIIDVNGANTGYTGNVTVTGGSELIMNNVQGVGDVGTITLNAVVDKLTLGELAAVAGTNPSGELKKTLAGVGEVALKNTADVTLAADNSSFAGTFNIDTNTHLRASEANNLGSAAILNEGALHLLTDSDWEFINTFTGSGSLEKLGAATLTINHDLAHTGNTDVNAGTLLVGDSVGSAATLSGGGDVNIASAAVLSGTGTVTGNVNNTGTIASLNALSTHSSDDISNLTVGALTNSGTVMLAGGSIGNTLTVKGGLTSNGGRIVMNTELGDDTSATDKLILDGGTTAGSTSLVVQDKGDGKGALTTQGIRLVETQNGATTTDDAFKLDAASSGYRNGAGTLAVGAYDYSLKRGGAGGIADDWYLTSAIHVDPQPGGDDTPAARPEAGSYLENQRVAQNMFNMSLHDREGMRPTGKGADHSGVWARVVDTHTKSHADKERLDTTGDSDIIQIGAELINWQGDNDSNFVAGVMGGYGKADSKTSSAAYDYSSKGKVEGYSTGLFGTWYQNQEMTGLYVDSWFQYGWYKNEANGDGLAQDKYDSTAWTASVEAGYALPLGETNGYRWIFEPQAQISYTDYSADEHRDAGGTRIELQDSNGVTTRIGAKLYSRKITTGGNTVQPFVQMNWLHTQNSGQVMMNNDVVQNNVPKDIGELKIGLESTFNTNWSVWGNLGLQQGSHDYSQVSGQAGVKYSW